MDIRIKAIEQADLNKWEQALRPEIKRLTAIDLATKEAN